MPLHTVEQPLELSSVNDIDAKYAIFYSSRDQNGIMWCPDCREVEGLIEKCFGGTDAPSAAIVYVGQRAEWKSATNLFRSQAWSINAVPTIVRIIDGKEAGRLVESEIDAEQLSHFIQA